MLILDLEFLSLFIYTLDLTQSLHERRVGRWLLLPSFEYWLDILSYAGMDEILHGLQFLALRVNFIRIEPVWDFGQFVAYSLY